MKRFSLRTFWPLLLLALLGLPRAFADERIRDFDSFIDVQKDGTLAVVETMQINVEHIRLNHGPYRDFPTNYTDSAGHNVRVGFHVLSVQRDGAPEPYH